VANAENVVNPPRKPTISSGAPRATAAPRRSPISAERAGNEASEHVHRERAERKRPTTSPVPERPLATPDIQ
jgi:hypothetical protein